MKLLLAYDGSSSSRATVEAAARLFPGFAAVVAHVRAPAHPVIPPAAPGAVLAAPLDLPEGEAERAARRTAEEGVDLASSFGLRASLTTGVGGSVPDIAGTLLQLADEQAADVIVIGVRHHSRIIAALVGSVSDDVVHKAAIPVLVVPDA